MARRRRYQRRTGASVLAVLVVAGVYLYTNHQNNNSNSTQQQGPNLVHHAAQKQGNVDYGSVEDDRPTTSLARSVLTDSVKERLNANSIHYNGVGAFIINDDKTNLDASISSAPYVQLKPVDSLQRPQVANAWLNRSSRQYQSRDETGNNARIYPAGWHQLRIGGRYEMLYNRGHSIGYALAGSVRGFDASEANERNITTQTAWANQASNGDSDNTGQNYFESQVRHALDQNQRVRYRVTPIYDGNNLVPSGSHLEAKSSNGRLEFNVFVPNVQPGVTINYATGTASLAN